MEQQALQLVELRQRLVRKDMDNRAALRERERELLSRKERRTRDQPYDINNTACVHSSSAAEKWAGNNHRSAQVEIRLPACERSGRDS